MKDQREREGERIRACNETKSEEMKKTEKWAGRGARRRRRGGMNGTRPPRNQGNCFIIIRAM